MQVDTVHDGRGQAGASPAVAAPERLPVRRHAVRGPGSGQVRAAATPGCKKEFPWGTIHEATRGQHLAVLKCARARGRVPVEHEFARGESVQAGGKPGTGPAGEVAQGAC